MAVTRPLRSPPHLSAGGGEQEKEQIQGTGSLGNTVLAALHLLPKLVTTGVRTSHPCAGSMQKRCGLVQPSLPRVESSTSAALPKPLAQASGCLCC